MKRHSSAVSVRTRIRRVSVAVEKGRRMRAMRMADAAKEAASTSSVAVLPQAAVARPPSPAPSSRPEE